MAYRAQRVMMTLLACFASMHRRAVVLQVRSAQTSTAYFQDLDSSKSILETPVLVASVAVMVLEAKSACDALIRSIEILDKCTLHLFWTYGIIFFKHFLVCCRFLNGVMSLS